MLPADVEATARELGGCLRALFRYAADSLVLLDPDGVICLWNPAAESLYGYRGEEMLGRADTFLIPSDRLRETEELRHRSLAGEPVESVATQRLSRQGARVAVALSLCRLCDDRGRAVSQGITVADIHIPMHGDAVDEPDETFLVRLSNPVNATIEDGDAVVTIQDDDNPPPSPAGLSVDDVSAIEGTGAPSRMIVPVRLSPPEPGGRREREQPPRAGHCHRG